MRIEVELVAINELPSDESDFTAAELAACTTMSPLRRSEHLAGKLAAKRAVAKGLLLPKSALGLIEIRNHDDGWPYAVLAATICSTLGTTEQQVGSISISHTAELACAAVVINS